MRVLQTAAVVAMLLPAGVRAQADNAPQRLTDRDKAAAVAQAIASMNGHLEAADKLVDKARDERDAERINCINGQKTQMREFLHLATLAEQELLAAERGRNSEAVDVEYQRVLEMQAKVAGLQTEAEQCIGLLAHFDRDETERTFTQDEQITEEDVISARRIDPATFRAPAASAKK